MGNWYESAQNVDMWYETALKHAVVAGKHSGIVAGRAADDIGMIGLVTDWLTGGKDLKDYPTGNDAITQFSLWLQSQCEQVKPLEAQTFTVQITKDYGGMTVTFGYSAVFNPGTKQGRRAAYDWCQDVVNQQFAEFEAKGIPKSRAPKPAENPTGTTEEIIVDSITVENSRGKLYAKVHGGRYSKFGVRVWEETLEQAGLSILDMGEGEHKVKGSALILMQEKEGRFTPQKVLRLTLE